MNVRGITQNRRSNGKLECSTDFTHPTGMVAHTTLTVSDGRAKPHPLPAVCTTPSQQPVCSFLDTTKNLVTHTAKTDAAQTRLHQEMTGSDCWRPFPVTKRITECEFEVLPTQRTFQSTNSDVQLDEHHTCPFHPQPLIGSTTHESRARYCTACQNDGITPIVCTDLTRMCCAHRMSATTIHCRSTHPSSRVEASNKKHLQTQITSKTTSTLTFTRCKSKSQTASKFATSLPDAPCESDQDKKKSPEAAHMPRR